MTLETGCICVGAEYVISNKRFKILNLIWGPTSDYRIFEVENCASLEKLALKQGKWAVEEWNLEWDALKQMEGRIGFPKVFHLSETVPRFMLMQLLGDSLDDIQNTMYEQKALPSHTIGSIGFQALERFEELHGQGIIQNDIMKTKSADLLRIRIGVGLGSEKTKLYLMHFSHMRPFDGLNETPAAQCEDLLPLANVLLSLACDCGKFRPGEPCRYHQLNCLLDSVENLKHGPPRYEDMRNLMMDMITEAGFKYHNEIIFDLHPPAL
jgi:hypothetical protein